MQRVPRTVALLLALHLIVVATAVACTGGGGDDGGQEADAPTTTALPPDDASVTADAPVLRSELTEGPDTADRVLLWTRLLETMSLTDAKLDEWRSRGVGGFVIMIGRLAGNGGTVELSDVPELTGSENRTVGAELTLRDSNIAQRARARGMKTYLGFYFANKFNDRTPLAEWFDNRAWAEELLPAVSTFAAAAARHGFDGIAVDQELYPQEGKKRTASWDWRYPDSTRRERLVRQKVKQRGAEFMTALVEAFPDIEVFAYGTIFPETWHGVVQQEENGNERAGVDSVQIDFWNGMTSVKGYGSVHFLEALFYKVPHAGSWDRALQHEMNSVFSLMSRRFSNWSYASSRVSESPFSWINSGPGTFDRARSPEHVDEQLRAFRKWGMDRVFANYVYGKLVESDYEPYLDSMRAAATPGRVDGAAPTFQLGSVHGHRGSAVLKGIANDNLAVRVVRWETEDGRSGVGTTEFQPGDASGEGHVVWTLPRIDVRGSATRLAITVEDIKGNTTTADVTLRRQ